MTIPVSKKVTEWIKEQGDIYGCWFYDWIQEGDLIDANVDEPRDNWPYLFEQGVEFGLALAESGCAFEASPYFEDTQFYFIGDEDTVFKKLKDAWAEEFKSDNPPMTEEEQSKLADHERIEEQIRALKERLALLENE